MARPFRTPAALGEALKRIIAQLEAGQTPTASPEAFPCFLPSALAGDPNVRPASLGAVLGSLTRADLPTLARALAALDANEQAWLGFKVVTDPAAAVDSLDTEVVDLRGNGQGSADDRHGVFLVLDGTGERSGAELVFGRECSRRDRMQMLDITRGPQMHGEQYQGVAWKALPLFRPARVVLMGAGTVSAEVERLANRIGFPTLVVDFDPAYLNAERFPHSELRLIEDFGAMPDLGIGPDDFVCVLTRGHMHDPQALVHGVRAGAGYVGMMGCQAKNERVFALAEQLGVERNVLQRTHTPIGLKFGAKSPAELAVAIVAELIQVKNNRPALVQA
jgi:xanthine dehydrogenase accessory factor